MRQRIHSCAAAVMGLLAGAAIVLHLTVRDGLALLAVFYYATPLILPAVALLAASAIWLRQRRRRLALAFGLGGAACLCIWHVETYVSRPSHPAASGPAVRSARVLVWNIGDGDLGFDAIVRRILHENADLVILGEAGRDIRDPETLRAMWQRSCPAYSVSPTRHGLIVLTRGTIEACRFGALGRKGKYQYIIVNLGGWRLHVIQPEIPSNPMLPRGRMLDELLDVVQSAGHVHLLVAGDFNTTPNSCFFDAWRSIMVNAFEAAGQGYYVSWPVPLPVLGLDHAWVSPSVTVRRAELGWSWRSDHKPLLLDMAPDRDLPEVSSRRDE